MGRPTRRTTLSYVTEFPMAAKWAVDRNFDTCPTHSLKFYRNELDFLADSQIHWTPYTRDPRYSELPEVCRASTRIWRAKVPLICIESFEMHNPDRVMRQFNMAQHIPEPVVHLPSLEGQTPARRQQMVDSVLTQWTYRQHAAVPQRDDVVPIKEYLEWFEEVGQGPLLRRNVPPLNYEPRGAVENALVSLMT
jgi:hypothetical protein